MPHSTPIQTSMVTLKAREKFSYLLEIGGCNGRIFPSPFYEIVDFVHYPSETLAISLVKSFALRLRARGDICSFFEEIKTLHNVRVYEI